MERCYEIIEDRSRRPPWSKALGEFESGIIGFEEYQRIVEIFEREGRLPHAAVPETRVQRPSREREDLKNAPCRTREPPPQRSTHERPRLV